MKRLPVTAQLVLAVLLFAFAMMGATNAQHTDAKAIYGILNALAGAWFVATVLRARALR